MFRSDIFPRHLRAFTLGLTAALAVSVSSACAEEPPRRLPEAALQATEAPGTRTAIVAGGCFWGIQGVFQHVRGVKQAVSGYAGGSQATARYDKVGTGRTGHAEAVAITYDPAEIRYDELLRIFFSVGLDPTQKDRQNHDVGTQYRSAIFPADADQARVAKAYIAQLDATKTYPKQIATTIETGTTFYPAEEYHQDYMVLNPTDSYIANQDMPKLRAFERYFPEHASKQPVLVGKGKPPA